MAKLTYKERKRLRSSDFADPKNREYPDEDKAHARDALSRVSEYGSPAEKALVRRRVHERYPDIQIEEHQG